MPRRTLNPDGSGDQTIISRVDCRGELSFDVECVPCPCCTAIAGDQCTMHGYNIELDEPHTARVKWFEKVKAAMGS